MNRTRRQLLGWGASAMLLGCGRSPQAQERYWREEFARQDEARAKAGLPELTPAERAWRYRLRHLRGGGELMVDGFGEKLGVNIFDEQGRLFFKSAAVNLRNRSKWAYSHELGAPLSLRAEWRDRYATDLVNDPPSC